MQRYTLASNLHDGMVLSQLAQSLQNAQGEIFSEKKGSQAVVDDPAARLMASSLVAFLDVDAMDQGFTEYIKVHDLVDSGSRDAQVSDVASRRWQDAKSAQAGAVNVGAMAGSIARYASSMEAKGMPTKSDPALRQIAHQIKSLFHVNLSDPVLVSTWQAQCRYAASAHNALIELSTINNSAEAAPQKI